MTLLDAVEEKEYIIKAIDTDDEEMNAFLFRLGCYSGEPVTLISKKRKSCSIPYQSKKQRSYNYSDGVIGLLSRARLLYQQEQTRQKTTCAARLFPIL